MRTIGELAPAIRKQAQREFGGVTDIELGRWCDTAGRGLPSSENLATFPDSNNTTDLVTTNTETFWSRFPLPEGPWEYDFYCYGDAHGWTLLGNLIIRKTDGGVEYNAGGSDWYPLEGAKA